MKQNSRSSICRAAAVIAITLMSFASADPAAKESAEQTASANALAALKFPGVTVNTELNCVDVDATICLAKGALEYVACTRQIKEHESLMVVDARPMHIHTALLLLVAKNSNPASRLIDEATGEWRVCAPQGDLIEVLLVVKNTEGKMIERSISDFISRSDDDADSSGTVKSEDSTLKKFPSLFIFTGSLLLEEGYAPHKYLVDTSSSVISISTFGDKSLCFSGLQSQINGALVWQINPEAIPKLDPKVILRLRPQKSVQKK